MNFNKLGLVVASAGAIFMATSCNKTVSLEKTTEWVNSHFTHGNMEETNVKELTVTLDGSGSKGEEAIANLNYTALMYGVKNLSAETLKGDATYAKENIPAEAIMLAWHKYYCSADSFTGEFTAESVKIYNTTFSIQNDELTVSSSYNCKDIDGAPYSEGRMQEKRKYDKNGAWLHYSMKIENGKALSYPDSVVNASVVVTCKY